MKNENLESIILETATEYGIDLAPLELSRSMSYLQLLLRWNLKISLTSVKDTSELVRHHLFEGFWAERKLPFPTESLADIGSGAGFPGIPMLILNPGRKTFFIEKSLKKTTFLSAVLRELSLTGRVINKTSEDASIWEEVKLVSVRALKLSDQTLRDLKAARIPILLLEGRDSQLKGKGWSPVLEETLPFSNNRLLRIFQPDVSRETIG